MNKINYPEDFRRKAEEVFPLPENSVLHGFLEEGNTFAIEMLKVYAQETITDDEVLAATSLEELQARAKMLKGRRELYAEAIRLR